MLAPAMLRWAAVAVAALLAAAPAAAFYLPGVAPNDFQKKDPLLVKVNKLTSTKTQLPYSYYSLPFCKPNTIVDSAENLGEVLRGDRIENSPYVFEMREPKMCQVVCRTTIDEKQAKELKEKIEDEYRVNMILDNLPLVVPIARQDKYAVVYQGGYHVGVKGQYAGNKDEKYFIHNHLTFLVKYHKDETTEFSRIVGFEVKPFSVNHQLDGAWNDKNTRLATCDPHANKVVINSDTPQEVEAGKEIIFTYDVGFEESDIKWASRWDTYLLMTDDQIHWFSIVNSLMIVLFLSVTSLSVAIGALGSPLGPRPERDLGIDLYSGSTPIANMNKSGRRISFNGMKKSVISLSAAIEASDPPLGPCPERDLATDLYSGSTSIDIKTGLIAGSVSDDFKKATTSLQEMFLSAHYAGDDLSPKFTNGEYRKKVHGPVFMYLNSSLDGSDPTMLWEDAKIQMTIEKKSWPYYFALSEDFQKTEQRGCVSGRLLVRDRYMEDQELYASGAYVGLALPGEAGSWQRECKGYQFWCRADEDGSFYIQNIVTGNYNLYAWVPGFIGDYKLDVTLTITSGDNIFLGDLVYEPPRDGPTIWEIGVPDRSAAEFYVPDPNPNYVNRLYINQPADRFRQYGLWDRYAELYPDSDLVYTIGKSNYSTDWFYAQVNRRTGQNTYQPTTWQIKFNLDSVNPNSTYKFRVALASSALAELQVFFNDQNRSVPHFGTGLIGRDNAIARHGIHGQYWLFNIDVNGAWLVQGMNTVYLKQARSQGPFQALMYDYLRLEGPCGC